MVDETETPCESVYVLTESISLVHDGGLYSRQWCRCTTVIELFSLLAASRVPVEAEVLEIEGGREPSVGATDDQNLEGVRGVLERSPVAVRAHSAKKRRMEATGILETPYLERTGVP